MKNILLICCVLLSFYGNAQLKLSKSLMQDSYVSLILKTEKGNPKSVNVRYTKDSITTITYDDNQNLKSYYFIDKKTNYEQNADYQYDSEENLLKKIEIGKIDKGGWNNETTYYRAKDSMFVIEIFQGCYGTQIQSINFEKIDTVKNTRLNISFSNHFVCESRAFLDSVLLKKMSNIDSAITIYQKGIFQNGSHNLTYYDTLFRPVLIEYQNPKERIRLPQNSLKGRRKPSTYENFYYNQSNSGASIYIDASVYYISDDPYRVKREFILNKNKQVIYTKGDLSLPPPDDYEEIHAKKKNIKLDKHGNWKRRKIYDVYQKKWITQRRKIKYW
jgi:hypothetical protein